MAGHGTMDDGKSAGREQAAQIAVTLFAVRYAVAIGERADIERASR
jgi:hypothetical protein